MGIAFLSFKRVGFIFPRRPKDFKAGKGHFEQISVCFRRGVWAVCISENPMPQSITSVNGS